MPKLGFLLAALLCCTSAPAPAQQQSTPSTIWSIWNSNRNWQPCGDFAFTLSLYPRGVMEANMIGMPFDPPPSWPYDAHRSITVIGWSVTQRLSDNTASGSWVVGSGHGGDGADVFASGGGIGTNSSRGFFPPKTGIPQGGANWASSRFDVYGSCDRGSQRFDVVIYYTAP